MSLTVVPVVCQSEKERALPAAGQIGDVTCSGDPAQSYALYLPSTYTPAKHWPIIYFFDPLGRGHRPLELYKDLAEKFSFVMAGSNNSRNFSNDESKSVTAIWQDTHLRLALDERLTYTSGFSGGARVAGSMALGCPQCQIAGVIAHGAGYPSSHSESKDKLLYFFAVGNQDFNWSEVMTIRRQREDRNLPYRVHVYAAAHQWAPAAVMEDAVEWLQLRAMKAGDRRVDSAFVDRLFQTRQAEADEAGKVNDAISEFAAYRSLVSDFAGLKDVTAFEQKLALLKNSPALRAALKKERDQIEDQSKLEADVSTKLRAYLGGSADDLVMLGNDVLQSMRRLDAEAERSKSESRRLVSRRAFAGLWAEGIESGQQELASRHFDKAEAFFELMSKVRSDPWPFLLLAETHAAAGNQKRAVQDLQEAVRHGLTDARVIESDDQLQLLKGNPDFQKLVAGLRKNQN